MIWEQIKEKNGFKRTTVPDLNIGDIILFEGETNETQGSRITDIFDNGYGSIFVEYIPEWTPVRHCSSFRYGTKKFRQKNLVVTN